VGDLEENINKKNSILLSRNTPVALVVGAAGFLGSHLVDALLNKNIQVVGVDDLTNGQQKNLQTAVQDKNFHLLIESADNLDLDLVRLDYIFIASGKQGGLDKVLNFFKKYRSRCLFISSIDLYEKQDDEKLAWLESFEKKLAKFASEHNLNARILRLGPVYGPRMDFKDKEPLVKLIQQALTDDLNSDVSLEFSSRALYCKDAIDLAIRTIFAGATSQKIFDGVLKAPVKVSEVKQVLMDPVWYENKGFSPTELPPWPTPNLEKSIKSLNWQPKSNLVSALRETLSYFKDNEIEIPKNEKEDVKPESPKADDGWKEDKKEQLEALKLKKTIPDIPKIKTKKGSDKIKFFPSLSKIYLLVAVGLVTYALVWPLFVLGWGVITFRYEMGESFKNLEKGEFESSLANINKAGVGVEAVKSVLDSLEPVRKTGVLNKQFELKDDLLNLSFLSVNSARSAILGTGSLLQGLKAVTGELTASPSGYFNSAQVELASAGKDLAKAQTLLQNNKFDGNITKTFTKLTQMSQLVERARALSVLLPALVAADGSAPKNYLILLQNNMELRPTGGFIGSFAKVSFEGGKLKKLDVNDSYAIDGQLGIHVEPPKEIKEDLGQKDWFMRDSNWEPDFPTSARQAEWFYTKETGERVDGVIALDISAMEKLIDSIGALNLSDYKEKITGENLFERAITHAEMGFFPGSSAKKSFLTALANEVFNKIFFLPQNNWPGIISALGRSLDEKHVGVYLNDPKMFSYIASQNWTHALPRQSSSSGDFLSLVEANLGANKVNYYLDRSYNLETVVGKEGEIKHRMRISYINRSPSDTFPAGTYKNRMRIYLPIGAKMTRALWGEADITKKMTGFSDYGRAGYSLLMELAPREQKTLVLDYTVPVKVEFKEDIATYRLDIIKQMGLLTDPFVWTISYPISYQLVSDAVKKIGPQQYSISTDLSRDRSFEVKFKK